MFLIADLGAQLVEPPRGIDHQPWHELVQRYVDNRGLVDYQNWKESQADLKKLRSYLEQFASADAESATGDERIASLINAYNAFTIDFILQNYPTKSIRLLDDEFKGKRYRIKHKDYHWGLNDQSTLGADYEHSIFNSIF
ncbi:MAG TPA: hypothetical protein VJ952_01530 [Opitutales bacterium]|nr:hypothetical protein [Opitutales bacterium]